MLSPFFFESPELPPPINHVPFLSRKKSINCLYPKNAKNKGIKKSLIFSLHSATPTPSSLDAGSSSTACEPPLQKEREGEREGQRGAKAGHADPSESSGHYYSPPMIQAVINHRHQLPVWPVFQCEKLLTLTITWCKGKPLSKNLKAKLHLHLRLQLPCLRWHQTHESDLFSHLFL